MKPLERPRARLKRDVLSLCIRIGACFYFASFASLAFSSTPPTHLCQKWIHKTEEHESLPPHLLGAIARVESGRLNKSQKKIEPWPWTINVNGQGYFFATKEAALKTIRRYQKRGIKNIDVGCMQINLNHHSHAFSSIAHALEPSNNVAYAARFLKKLRQAHASWDKAVAHYHSATPFYHIPYHQKVYRAWLGEHDPTFLGRQEAMALTGVLPPSFYGYFTATHKRLSRKEPGRRYLIATTALSQDSARLQHIRPFKVTGATYQRGVRILRGKGR